MVYKGLLVGIIKGVLCQAEVDAAEGRLHQGEHHQDVQVGTSHTGGRHGGNVRIGQEDVFQTGKSLPRYPGFALSLAPLKQKIPHDLMTP